MDWAEDVPHDVLFDLFGKKVYMVHNKRQMSEKAEEADIIIYGHSHKYEAIEEDGKLYLNPGSAGPRRFGRPVSMMILVIDTDADEISIEKIDL